jgi:hypothetical protein
MINILDIRRQFPEYGDLSDQALLAGLHRRYYADVPIEEFTAKVGAPADPGFIDNIVGSGKRGLLSAEQATVTNAAAVGAVSPEAAGDYIAETQREIDAIAVPQSVQRFFGAEGWGDAVLEFSRSPLEITSTLVAQSLGTSIPSFAGAAAGAGLGSLGGPAGAMVGGVVGLGAGSAHTETGAKIIESFAEHGVDLTDPAQVAGAFADGGLIEQVRGDAIKRGVTIGVFDAVSGALAGRLVAGARTAGQFARRGAGEIGIQAGLGMGGEAAGSAVVGDPISPPDVLAEGIGSMGPGVVEMAAGTAMRGFGGAGQAAREDQPEIARRRAAARAEDPYFTEDMAPAPDADTESAAAAPETGAPAPEQTGQAPLGLPRPATMYGDGFTAAPMGDAGPAPAPRPTTPAAKPTPLPKDMPADPIQRAAYVVGQIPAGQPIRRDVLQRASGLKGNMQIRALMRALEGSGYAAQRDGRLVSTGRASAAAGGTGGMGRPGPTTEGQPAATPDPIPTQPERPLPEFVPQPDVTAAAPTLPAPGTRVRVLGQDGSEFGVATVAGYTEGQRPRVRFAEGGVGTVKQPFADLVRMEPVDDLPAAPVDQGGTTPIETPQPDGAPVAEQAAAAPTAPVSADRASPTAAVKIDADLGATPSAVEPIGTQLAPNLLADQAAPNAAETGGYTAPTPSPVSTAPVTAEPQQDQAGAPAPEQASAPESATPATPVEAASTVRMTAPDAAPARRPLPRRDIANAADTAVTSSGREVPVRYAVVEAADLVASQTDDGRANPAYPQEMQPRDRDRATSQAQVTDIARNLNPRLLDRSPRASDGAPIVADDGTVESGNGRVLAIRQAYGQGGAQAYRDYLAAQGYPVEGMTAPVLVRVREGQMAPADRQAFTREANERDTLAMSATERAMADAAALPDDALALYRGGDIDAAGNRDFVRRFVSAVAARNDRAGMIAADGTISQEAVRRIEAALLARAYGDADLVADLVESADTNIRAIGGAMMDVAGVWAGMRAEAAAGRIAPEMDQTAALLEAVKLVQRARRDGRNLAEYVSQTDMLSGRSISTAGEAFLRLFFRNRRTWTQPAGREKVAEALRFYVTEAGKTTAGVDLLGQAAVSPGDILATAEERQYGRDRPSEADQGNLLTQPARSTGERPRQDGGERAERAEPDGRTADGGEAARDRGEGASPEVGGDLREDGPPTSDKPNPENYVDLWQDVAGRLDGVDGLDARMAVADAWVLEKGLETGHEYIAVFDRDGALLQAGTMGHPSKINFSGATLDRMTQAGAGLAFTHNHPTGRSFSVADLVNLALPGVDVVHITAEGAGYTVRAADGVRDALGGDWQALSAALTAINKMLHHRTQEAIHDKKISHAEATEYFNHAFNTLLHRLGITTYEASVPSDALSDAFTAVLNASMTFARSIAKQIPGRTERKSNEASYLPARRAQSLRAGLGVADVRGRAEGSAEGSAGGEDSAEAGLGVAPPEGGEPEGLSEERQTDTPAFRRWFGDSKVVDESGEPLVVYHGSRARGIEAFDAGDGVYFTPDRTAAEGYPDMAGYDPDGRVYAAFVSLQNPMSVDAPASGPDTPASFMTSRRRQELERQGYDGVIARRPDGTIAEIVAFRPEQIKSATGNRGTFDPDDPNILREVAPRFDIATAEKRAASRLTPQDRALIDKHLAPAGGGPISRIAKAAFVRDMARNGIADTLVTQLVNQLNPIFAYEKRAEQITGGTARIRDASVSAAKMAEFTMNDTGRTWAMFHVGPLRYNAAEGIVEADESGRGLHEIFAYLSDPDAYDKFRLYAAARRGQRLMSEGRERNLTPEAIERGLAMADDVGSHKGETRTFRQIFDDYQAFNVALLNGMGRDTGLLTQAEIDLWTEHADYIPFYREMDEDGALPTTAWLKKNINNPDPGIKALEGGKQRVGDLMENIVRNAEAITRAGMRNITMKRVHDLAQVLGEGRVVKEGSAEDGVLVYKADGKEVRFQVDDPALVAAVAAMRPEQHSGLYKALTEVTAFFRNGITASPAFMIRNLVRGTTAGFVQTGKNIGAGGWAGTGLVRALRNDRSIRELKAISGTGAYTFGGSGGGAAALLRRSTGAQRDAMPIAVVRKMWGALERLGEATELADRDAIYRNLLRDGKSKAEAAYQAMNLINYSRRGASKSLRVLLPLVPFLNARIQGLYRMAETQTTGPERTKKLAGVAARGMVLTAASMALYALQGDDDRYDDEPLHRKLAYYIVYAGDTRILIPKAFEFGAIFSTLPELVVDAVAKNEGKRLAQGLAQTVLTTFAFNPIPQPALPILENIANYNFFTGREIENARLQNMRPGDRYTAATPHVLRELGRAMNFSPVQIENLIRGYTGTMGMSFLAGIDSIGRAAGAFPNEPSGPFGDYGLFSDFMTDQIGSMYRVGPDRANRWVGDLYEMSRDINQAWRHVQALGEAGEVEEARRAAEAGNVGLRTFLNRQTRALGKINAQIRRVEDDAGMDGRRKRAELDRLYQVRNEIAETAVKEAKKAGAR